MTTVGASLGLSESTYVVLEQLIRERIGIHYSNSRRDMMLDKLSELVVEYGFHSYLDFYYMLKYEATEREWNRVMDVLAVQETYFCREYDQIDALVNTLLPQLYRDRPNRRLTIWSAACASGEEPFSIAMALEEAGWLERMDIQLIGSDASPKALEKAEKGIYRDYSLRHVPERLRGRYFTQESEGWRLDSQIQRRVQFRHANLVQPHTFSNLALSEIVFCRNVFIYFDDKTIESVVKSLSKNTIGKKYLFLGTAESLLRLHTPFSLEKVGNAYVYTHLANSPAE